MFLKIARPQRFVNGCCCTAVIRILQAWIAVSTLAIMARPAAHVVEHGPIWSPQAMSSRGAMTNGSVNRAIDQANRRLLKKASQCLSFGHTMPCWW